MRGRKRGIKEAQQDLNLEKIRVRTLLAVASDMAPWQIAVAKEFFQDTSISLETAQARAKGVPSGYRAATDPLLVEFIKSVNEASVAVQLTSAGSLAAEAMKHYLAALEADDQRAVMAWFDRLVALSDIQKTRPEALTQTAPVLSVPSLAPPRDPLEDE